VTSQPPRIAAFDAARAFAVLGMVLVNFKVVAGAAGRGPRWLTLATDFIDGKAAATFVVLAGVGLALLTRRARESGDASQLRSARLSILKRAAFLFVVGALYTPIWPADILHFYGVYLVGAALVFAWSTPALLAGAVAVNAVFVAMLLLLDYERGWNWETIEYAGLWTARGSLRHLLFNGFHPAFPWAGFLAVGLVVGRLDLRAARVRRRLLVGGLALLVGITVLSETLVAVLPAADDPALVRALVGTAPMPPVPTYFLAGTGAALTAIGSCAYLEAGFGARGWFRVLVHTGQLALSLYVAHVLVGMGTLEALGRLEDQTLVFATAAALVFTVSGAAFATLWRRRFARGPLEALMRFVTG